MTGEPGVELGRRSSAGHGRLRPGDVPASLPGRRSSAGDGRLHPGNVRLRLGIILVLASLLAACSPAPVVPTPSTPAASTAVASSSPRSPTPVPSPSAAAAEWSDCGRGYQCATVDVPLDYSNAAGSILHLALIRLPASDPSHRIGALLTNPGGPGESGVDFVRDGATTAFPAEIRKRFDIVGFDPRGIGASTEIRCVDNLDHFIPADLVPDTPAQLATLVAGQKGFAEGCAERNPDLIAHLSTEDAARDLDLIRQSLGEPKLTYIGFSYGTLLGSTYASLFPDRIRALVLDGALDPSLTLLQVREGQSVAFQAAFNRFIADCAATVSCAFNYGSRTRSVFERLMKQIETTPLPAPLLPGRGDLTSADAWSAVLGAMYSKDSWPVLARGLALAAQGDGSLLLAISDPFRGRKSNGAYSNMPDAYAAYTCLDYQGPTGGAALSTMAANAAAWAKAAPDFGPIMAWNDLACAYWGHPAERVAAPASAAGAPPIVVVGSSGDPATPYSWAVALAKQLPGAILITRRGEGHTGYEFSSCVQKAVDAYLVSLTLPKQGLVCGTDG